MSAVKDEIMRVLFSLRDEKYRDFQGPLIPTVPSGAFLGVRTPDLRRLAKEFSRRADIGDFLKDLPHDTFDETQLHAFIISEERDFDRCLAEVDAFLP
ncbi:MAG: DNA alkylation repair protein, partial [Clostridia bacterium]|nr:DNA alkylation repair protein [Clostridia bacterium]